MSKPFLALGAVAAINPPADPHGLPEYPFLPMSDVNADGLAVKPTEVKLATDLSSGLTQFRSGDIVLAKITPCFENGKITRVFLERETDVGFGSTEFHVVRPDPKLADAQYVLHFLRRQSIRVDGARRMTGSAGQRRVPRAFLEELQIPLPSLDEQRRIAVILDHADALRTKRRQSIAHLDELTPAIFLEMFGDPVSNPRHFPTGTIEDAVRDPKKDIRCGPFGTQLKVSEISKEGIPLLGIENVVSNTFTKGAAKCVSERKALELEAFNVAPGDVLVTRMGTIGRACVVPDSVSNARFSYHLFRIRPDQSKCLPSFLAHTITSSGTFKRQLDQLAHGQIMAGLSTSDLKSVRFLFPPISEQIRFNLHVEQIETMRERQNRALDGLNTLFASLQHRAFRGEL